jgi:hypothetical protein
MKLLIMQFSPTSCHFIPLRSKYSPEHSVLKHPQSMFLPYCQRPSFTPMQCLHFGKGSFWTMSAPKCVLFADWISGQPTWSKPVKIPCGWANYALGCLWKLVIRVHLILLWSKHADCNPMGTTITYWSNFLYSVLNPLFSYENIAPN